MIKIVRGAAALIGASLLASACSGNGGNESANNSAAALTGATNAFAIGPDASAMETVGSGEAIGSEPMVPMGNGAAEAGDSSSGANKAAPANGGGSGNRVESNVSGM